MKNISNLKSHISHLKILIRLPNWLGDVVMSTAFIGVVREFYPDAVIDVIIKTELGGVAALIPGINKVHLFSKKENSGLPGVFRFGKKLRDEHYDLFFNLPSSLSSLVLAWATGAKNRVGFKAEGGLFLLTNSFKKPEGVHRVVEYISLAEQFWGMKASAAAVALKATNSGQPKNGTVLINFNSEAESRRMPLDKAKTIVNSLTNTFPGITFTFIGSPQESAFVEEIINGVENADRIENLAGKTSLPALVDLMAASTAILTTDSGPAHLANSVALPTIVLFGAGNEHNTAPHNKTDLTVLRYGKLDCEPCVKNTCKLYGIPKCMQLIDEMNIISALRVYLPHA